MRRSSFVRMPITLLCALALTACGVGPTEKDIINALNDELASVSGSWTGINTGPSPVLSLTFSLTQGANGSVTGSGTMREASAPSSVPITITGTYARPVLTLTFNGMVYESTSVQGSFQGNYTTVGGVLSNLQLTGTGYNKTIVMLLQEQ